MPSGYDDLPMTYCGIMGNAGRKQKFVMLISDQVQRKCFNYFFHLFKEGLVIPTGLSAPQVRQVRTKEHASLCEH